jgi:hypothetical protein
MILIIEEGVLIAILAVGFITFGMKMYKTMKGEGEAVSESGLKTIKQADGTVVEVVETKKINGQFLFPLENSSVK